MRLPRFARNDKEGGSERQSNCIARHNVPKQSLGIGALRSNDRKGLKCV
jgi:hypothetical protein